MYFRPMTMDYQEIVEWEDGYYCPIYYYEY